MFPSMRHLDMPMRLAHLSKLGFDPAVIFDVGAAHGSWAREVAGIWPKAKIFGFEPNLSEVPSLKATQRDLPQFQFRRCFLGPERGVVKYEPAGTRTSLIDECADGTGSAEAPMEVLDELIAGGELPVPQFVKLDVQGFELQVLAGARRLLEQTQAVMLEVAMYDSDRSVPTAAEVIAFMTSRHFAWYDVAGIVRRPKDDALWQMDLLFLKADHALRSSKLYG